LWLKIIAKLLVLTVKGLRDEQREKSVKTSKKFQLNGWFQVFKFKK